MVIHDRFVFLHVPKTGGTFLRQTLAQELPGQWLPGDASGTAHSGWDEIPAQARHLPVLGFVRNPWDWYVSWYCFLIHQLPQSARELKETRPLFYWLFADSGDGRTKLNPETDRYMVNDFATTVRRACGDIADSPVAAELKRSMSQERSLARLLFEGNDFYTARLKVTLGPALESNLATIGCFESLLDDLEAFLESAGVDLPDGAMTRIRAAEPVNISPRGPYRDYYDDDLRELVGGACRPLIERFGYEF